MQISDNLHFEFFSSPPHKNGGGNILVVDDDPRVVETIKQVLEKMGEYTVLVARSGHECLRQVREETPALILLDIQMPEADGINVLRQLRSQSETKDIPVLMVSVDAQFDRMAACYEAGANGFLIKPLDSANLYQQVRNAIAQHKVGMLRRDAIK